MTSVTSSSTTLLFQNELNNLNDDSLIEQLKEALEERSQIATKLNQIKSTKIPISLISKDLIDYCYSHDDPILMDVQNNPWKKSSITSSSTTTTAQAASNNSTTKDLSTGSNTKQTIMKKDSDVEIVALGVDSQKVEQILMNMKDKSDQPVTEAERNHFTDELIDMAISVLRILLTELIQSLTYEARSNSITNSQKIIKPKDETYNKRPLPHNLIQELKVYWNDSNLQNLYQTRRNDILPKHLIYAIEKYNVCERFFGDSPLKLEDSEILSLLGKSPLNPGIVEYILPKFKIYDISSLKFENMENWLSVFFDCKTFVWICSLASFDQVMLDNKKIKFTSIQPKNNRLNGKSKATSNNNTLNYVNNTTSNSPPNSPPTPIHNHQTNPNSHITTSNPNQMISQNESNILVEYSAVSLPPNSLSRSIELFKIFSKNIKRPPIVFLTDKDQFADKVTKSDFKTYFPNYNGGPKKPKEILDYIKNLFNPNNDVTVHFTRLDPKEDEKVIAATLYAIAAEESIDILI